MILFELFLTFFKIGMFTFGGGYAMLPLIQEEVIKNAWIEKETLIDFVAISESTPGPFAVNISTVIGANLNGFLGALFATLGVVLPSFIIILLVAKFFNKFKESKIVKGCMNGLKPCVIGLICGAVISMFLTVFASNGIDNIILDKNLLVSLGIFIVSLILVKKKVNPILIICLSAIIGIGCGFLVL